MLMDCVDFDIICQNFYTASNLKDLFHNIHPMGIISFMHAIGLTKQTVNYFRCDIASICVHKMPYKTITIHASVLIWGVCLNRCLFQSWMSNGSVMVVPVLLIPLSVLADHHEFSLMKTLAGNCCSHCWITRNSLLGTVETSRSRWHATLFYLYTGCLKNTAGTETSRTSAIHE